VLETSRRSACHSCDNRRLIETLTPIKGIRKHTLIVRQSTTRTPIEVTPLLDRPDIGGRGAGGPRRPPIGLHKSGNIYRPALRNRNSITGPPDPIGQGKSCLQFCLPPAIRRPVDKRAVDLTVVGRHHEPTTERRESTCSFSALASP